MLCRIKGEPEKESFTPDETNKQTNKQINKPETPKVFRFYRATAIKLVHV